MQVQIDSAGNLRALYAGSDPSAGRILIGSHLDTVPDAGRFDGVLGVVLAISLVEHLHGERLPFAIEVIGFSEEEGVRFGFPFIGSRGFIGDLDRTSLDRSDSAGITVAQALQTFGLDPTQLTQPLSDPRTWAYIEFHIEQGPVLEALGYGLGTVDAIVGQSRASVTFIGKANHAGTTPMHLRKDALCAGAQWALFVEQYAHRTDGLVATVGKAEVKPGAGNSVPGEATLSLDVRHAVDDMRHAAVSQLFAEADQIAGKRGLHCDSKLLMDQAAVPMHAGLTRRVERALQAAGIQSHRMTSGAGHDAMILAPKIPSAMIFVQSLGGISHHPAETVREQDIALALRAGLALLRDFSTCPFRT